MLDVSKNNTEKKLRKGIVKLINQYTPFGNEVTDYFKETDLPLKTVEHIASYITRNLCYLNQKDNSNKQKNIHRIMKEIKKYDHYPIEVIKMILPYGHDTLIGCNDIKNKIIKFYEENPRFGHLSHCIYRECFDKDIEDVLFELGELHLQNRPVPDAYNNCYYDYNFFTFELHGFAFAEDIHKGIVKRHPYDNFDADWVLKKALWDDFVQNKRESFLYKKVSEGYIICTSNYEHQNNPWYTGFEISEKEYENFLNYGKGQVFANFISRYFKTEEQENNNFLATSKQCRFKDEAMIDVLCNNPVIKSVMAMIKDGVVSPNVRLTHVKSCVEYDEKKVEILKNACPDTEISFKSPYFYVDYTCNRSGALIINLKLYPDTKIFYAYAGGSTYQVRDDGVFVDGVGKPLSLTVFILGNKQAYVKSPKNGRTFPLSMKRLAPFLKYKGLYDFFEQFAKQTGNMFIMDVVNDIVECGENFVSPITFGEISEYYNRHDYFMDKYKKAGMIKWNYNRHNINLSYMIVKSLDKVDKCDWGILQNCSNDMMKYILNFQYTRNGINLSVTEFLAGFYISRMSDKEFSDYNIKARDFITLSIAERGSVILHYSIKRMADEHDHFHDNRSYKSYLKQVRPFRIPKDSVFKNLRKILPKGFEWIKTRKRLINETIEMHHCVWSYYEKIANDMCAIYSYYDATGQFDVSNQNTPKRYTIEFIWSKNKYRISQIQTKHDRGGGQLLKKYLNLILSNKK